MKRMILSITFAFCFILILMSLKTYRFEDEELTRTIIPNDPYISNQSALNTIKAYDAWSYATDASNIKVAIIGSGINAYHEDLSANMNFNYSYCYDSNDSAFYDNTGHGTAIAGIIGATTNNNIGVAGVCWGVDMYSFKVNNSNDSYSNSNVAAAINYASSIGIDIINMSFGLLEYSSEVDAAISNFDGLIVCSSGNLGYDNDLYQHYPSNYSHDNIIAVGGISNDYSIHPNSNYGLTTVDLFAPMATYTTYYDSTNSSLKYAYLTGTSYAAAYVVGAVALLESEHPDLTPLGIKDLLLSRVSKKDNLQGKCVSGGALSLFNFFHNHSNTYSYYDNTYHTCTCSICGDSYRSLHHWTQIYTNNFALVAEPNIRIRYECVDCGAFSLNPYI